MTRTVFLGVALAFGLATVAGAAVTCACVVVMAGAAGVLTVMVNGADAVLGPAVLESVTVTVKVTAPAGAIIFENGATLANLPLDPNMANNTASARVMVQ